MCSCFRHILSLVSFACSCSIVPFFYLFRIDPFLRWLVVVVAILCHCPNSGVVECSRGGRCGSARAGTKREAGFPLSLAPPSPGSRSEYLVRRPLFSLRPVLRGILARHPIVVLVLALVIFAMSLVLPRPERIASL
jgi:hypothetical protein